MLGTTFWTILFILSISLIVSNNGSDQQCRASQYNGKPGFCISSGNCNGLSDSSINLCGGQGIVCCYGNFKPLNQDTTSQSPDSCQTTSRKSWRALSSRNTLKDLAPVSHIFIHHTNDGNSCQNEESCSLRVRSLQSYHQLTKKWDDIAWNFLIGGDGKVYEGIGWKKQGFHTLNWNDKSLGIAFIGNFIEKNQNIDNILDRMLDALDKLITCGLNQGYIKSGFKMHGHRDVRGMTTRCPGDYLYSELKEQFNSFESGPI